MAQVGRISGPLLEANLLRQGVTLGISSRGVGSLKKEKKRVASDLIRKGDRALFLKATHCNGDVQVLEGQSSAMLHTFARCNALIYISLDEASVKKGEEVNCYLLNE